MADSSTLAEAKTAYKDLISGEKPARVRDQSGDEIQYSRADPTRLLTYIRELERACDTAAVGAKGPLRVYF